MSQIQDDLIDGLDHEDLSYGWRGVKCNLMVTKMTVYSKQIDEEMKLTITLRSPDLFRLSEFIQSSITEVSMSTTLTMFIKRCEDDTLTVTVLVGFDLSKLS